MSSLVGGTGIIGEDMVCGISNGKYTQFEGTEIAENCVKAKVKDFGVEGKTYQNLFKAELSQGHVGNSSTTYDLRVNSEGFSLEKKTYTLYINTDYQLLLYYDYISTASPYVSWTDKIVWTNSSEDNNIRIMVKKTDNSEITVDEVIGKVVLLEGDYTDIDLPASIDGIESVAEKERNLADYIVNAIGTLGTKVIFDNKNCLKITSTFSKNIILPDVSDYKIHVSAYANNTENKNYSIGNFNDMYISPGIKKWQSNTLTGNLNKFSIYNYQNSEVYIDLDTISLVRVYNPYPLKLKINEENNYINLPIPLRSLPNGVADTIEGDNLVQRVGKIVFSGLEGTGLVWQVGTPYDNNFILYHVLDLSWNGKGDGNLISIISDKFAGIKDNEWRGSKPNSCFMNAGGKIHFLVSKEEFPTSTNFDNWLKNNPTTIYYPLATPIIHSLEIPQLSTAKGTNIITTENNIKPKLSMKVKAKK